MLRFQSLRFCSFGPDHLSPVIGRSRSVRRLVRLVLAARRRWPHGRLVLRVSVEFSALWLVALWSVGGQGAVHASVGVGWRSFWP